MAASDDRLRIDLPDAVDAPLSEPPKIKSKKRKKSSARHSLVLPSDGAASPQVPCTDACSVQPSCSTDTDNSLATAEEAPPSTTNEVSPIEAVEGRMRDASTCVRTTVGTATEPQLLGPCQAGTPVALEGVVWHETSAGLLVVNVTWRGNSYVGTLLDCAKHDWASPRQCDSDSAAPAVMRTPAKGRNGKRSGAPMRGCHSASTSDLSALKHKAKAKAAHKLTVSIPTPSATSDEDSQPPSAPVQPAVELQAVSPVLRDCPCRSCAKRFLCDTAVKYHQNAAHRCPSPAAALKSVSVACQVNRSPAASRIHSAGAADRVASPSRDLSAAEHESLEKLFQVVDKAEPQCNGAAVQPPKLEATTAKRPSSASAYSDISDDGAPVLEKEVSDKSSLCSTPVKGTPSAASRRQIDASVDAAVAPPSPKRVCMKSRDQSSLPIAPAKCDVSFGGSSAAPLPIGFAAPTAAVVAFPGAPAGFPGLVLPVSLGVAPACDVNVAKDTRVVVSDSQNSPPVQRHLHMHQHTYSPYLAIDPYTLLASQSAAAVGYAQMKQTETTGVNWTANANRSDEQRGVQHIQ